MACVIEMRFQVRSMLHFKGTELVNNLCTDMLVELARREKEAGIFPEQDVDVYMKAIAVEGQEHSLVTDYIMKVT